MTVKDTLVFESKLEQTSAYVHNSYFINKDSKIKIQWFSVLFKDNKSGRSFQKHEVHVPQNVMKKDLEAIKESVIQYVKIAQLVYEKY